MSVSDEERLYARFAHLPRPNYPFPNLVNPHIDELAGEYAGRLKVVKINVDDNPETPARYGVRGIPNLLIIRGGQVKEQIVGAVPKSHLVRAVDSAIG